MEDTMWGWQSLGGSWNQCSMRVCFCICLYMWERWLRSNDWSVICEDHNRDCALETLTGQGCICQRCAGVSVWVHNERLCKCVTWFWELLHPMSLTHWLINTMYSGVAYPIKSLLEWEQGCPRSDSIDVPALEPDNNEMLVSDRRRGKELGLWNRGLIIAAETVLFPPLTGKPSSHFYTRTHTEAQADTHQLGKEFEQ